MLDFLPPGLQGHDLFVIEAGLVLLAICISLNAPKLGDGFFRAIEGAFARFARRPVLSLVAMGIAPLALRALLADSVSTFCTLFRHALILHGDEEQGNKRGVMEAAQRRFGIDAAPFRTLLDLRENLIKAKDVDPNLLLGPCLGEIGKVIAAMDQLKQGEN